jgi:hypothetical protein
VRESGAAREERRPMAGRRDGGGGRKGVRESEDRGGWGSGGREGGVTVAATGQREGSERV